MADYKNFKVDPWVNTYSGKKFDFLNTDPDSIDIYDIAWALSRQVRWLGHTDRPYTIAEHCCHVHDLFDEDCYRVQGLMHDASEAYMGDIPLPLKQLLPNYKRIEKEVMLAIANKFEFSYPLDETVVEYDTRMLINESEDIISLKAEPFTLVGERLNGVNIQCWTPTRGYSEFIQRAKDLGLTEYC